METTAQDPGLASLNLRALEKKAPSKIGLIGAVTIVAAWTKNNVVFLRPPKNTTELLDSVFKQGFTPKALKKYGTPSLILFFKTSDRPQIVELDWSEEKQCLLFNRFVKPVAVIGAGHPRIVQMIFRSGNPGHLVSWCELPDAADDLQYRWPSRQIAYKLMRKHVSSWADSSPERLCMASLEKYARSQERWTTHKRS